MKKAIIVLSAPEMFGFMRGQAARLKSAGYSALVIAGPSTRLDQHAIADGAKRLTIEVVRDISPLRDICSFIRLAWEIWRQAPEVVLLSGPKAIFIGGMASWLSCVPTRVAIYHGMRQETLRPPLLWLLDLCDRVSFACATKVLAVSPSLRDLVLTRRLTKQVKIAVIGKGTANGVDTERFAPTAEGIVRSVKLRQGLGIPEGVPIIGFVGRLTEDKGIADAYAAFCELRREHKQIHLLLIGRNEMRTPAGLELSIRLRADPHVRIIDHTDDVASHLHLLWAQVFPSAREGLPMVVVEAAALAVPTVGYDVTGVRDAIADGETGVLVPRGNVASLAKALGQYLTDADLRRRHGSSAMLRVRKLYAPGIAWKAYLEAMEIPEDKLDVPLQVAVQLEEKEALSMRERFLR
jgi:glycosyltransferase involved in cell wall biosynthesis